MGFDFEIGNSDFAVTHEIQKRPSTLGKPSLKWISIRNLTPDLLDFYFFAFFRETKKGSQSSRRGLIEVNRCYRTKKKKLELDFFRGNLEDRFFSVGILFCFSFFTIKYVF